MRNAERSHGCKCGALPSAEPSASSLMQQRSTRKGNANELLRGGQGLSSSCNALTVLLLLVNGAATTEALSSQGLSHTSPFYPRTSSIEQYFDNVVSDAPGVWKWRQYFNVYAKHLERFRGTNVHFMEIGIFSGGSLRMWRWFFGSKATIYGLDVNKRTLVYQGNPKYGSPNEIIIGDQSDMKFWHTFKQNHKRLDVVLEDGGHKPSDQRCALEALWPHISLGGVYMTEDVHGLQHEYAKYIFDRFVYNAEGMMSWHAPSARNLTSSRLSRGTQSVAAVSFYHYILVLDKVPTVAYRDQIHAEQHGVMGLPPA